MAYRGQSWQDARSFRASICATLVYSRSSQLQLVCLAVSVHIPVLFIVQVPLCVALCSASHSSMLPRCRRQVPNANTLAEVRGTVYMKYNPKSQASWNITDTISCVWQSARAVDCFSEQHSAHRRQQLDLLCYCYASAASHSGELPGALHCHLLDPVVIAPACSRATSAYITGRTVVCWCSWDRSSWVTSH